MKTWQGWITPQTRGAKNKAMIYGHPMNGLGEVRVRAWDRDEAARIIAGRLSELLPDLFPRNDRRPVAGKSYLVWMKDH